MTAAASRPELPERITRGRVIAIARGLSTDAVLGTVDALVASGIRAVEVTLDSPDALRTIAALSERAGEVEVGAGTVLDVAAAERAVAAGATYLISPITDPTLLSWSVRREVPTLPGAGTATEAWTAWTAGAAAVKLFPAGPAGPRHLRALVEPLPGLRFVPTGGIDASNAAAFLATGAVAVGVGGWLLGAGDPREVAARADELVRASSQPSARRIDQTDEEGRV